MGDLICKGCGKCCGEFFLKDSWFDVELHDDDRKRIPEEFQEFRDGGDLLQPQPYYWLKRKENGSCIFLNDETKLCTIYDNRPQICRDFNPSHPKCLEHLK